MDELLKLLKELLEREPTPKGGIANTPAGIDFIGRTLTKEEKGADMILSGKLTDASRFKPFAIENIGRDQRYVYIQEYASDITNSFEKTIKFLKENPDIRLTQIQKDNLLYNIGVLRRVTKEKNKLEKGIIDGGKKPEDIIKNYMDNKPFEDMSFSEKVTEIGKTNEKLKQSIKDMENLFKTDIDAAKVERLNNLYYGRGFKAGEANFRGLGGYFLPKLHEAGVIKLDDAIYQRLKKR